MSLNIIDLITGQFGPAIISQASTHLGESESGISKAISALLPIVVGGMANNADKPGVLDSILGASSDDLLGNLMGDSHNSMIATILTALFGDKLSTITNSVSNFAGISDDSSAAVLNMVTAATIGTLGKYASENNMGSAGLSTLLADQKSVASALLPAGISLATLGLGDWGHTETIVPPTPENVTVTSYDDPKVDVTRGGETHMNVESDNNEGGGSIWKWLFPLLLAFLAGWFIWNQYNKNKAANTVNNKDSSTMIKSDSMNTKMMTDSTAINSSTKMNKTADSTGK